MAKQAQDMVMTIDDLAEYLKLSTSTLYKLCAEGKVPGHKVGRHWRFHRTVIDQWIGVKPGTTPVAETSAGSAGTGRVAGRVERGVVLQVLRPELRLTTQDAQGGPLGDADAPGSEGALGLFVALGELRQGMRLYLLEKAHLFDPERGNLEAFVTHTIAEHRDGYPHRLRAIGHLHEAEDESQAWPKLHDAIRAARKAYQQTAAMPDFAALAEGVAARRPLAVPVSKPTDTQ
jgi:excisionase family DNA binding protein